MPLRETLSRRRATWFLRGRTLLAMVLLCLARLAVEWVPFRYWRGTLGQPVPPSQAPDPAAGGALAPARRLAVHVERGAARLPFATKCLPRAMALCWLLRAAHIGYRCKIAARPAAIRQDHARAVNDDLHAWVEVGGTPVIGALPGPWLVVLALQG